MNVFIRSVPVSIVVPGRSIVLRYRGLQTSGKIYAQTIKPLNAHGEGLMVEKLLQIFKLISYFTENCIN